MTRINTNVSALVAQKVFGRNDNSLQTALTRLSTGLRINSGKDDPAGLIAAEIIRKDIVSIEKAISNTERANQVIGTADSALGQASSLLNDIRALVTESANTGALSDEQIEANQLQVDSALEALNRISQSVTFQGRKLLDGSLDFITSAGANYDRVSDLQIDQANLGATGSLNATINVTSAATQALVNVTNVPVAVTAVNASGDVSLSNTIQQASTGPIVLGPGGETITIDAVGGQDFDGAAGNLNVSIIEDIGVGAGVATAALVGGGSTLEIRVGDNTTTLAAIETAVEALDAGGVAGADFAVTVSAAAAVDTTILPQGVALSGGRDAGSATLNVTADTAGTAGNLNTVQIIEDNTLGADTVTAAQVGNNLEVRLNGSVSYTDIANAISGVTGFTASISATTGDANYVTDDDTPPADTPLTGGVDGSGGLAQAVVFELSGTDGSDVFNFEAGTGIADIAAAVNLVSDATGVEATVNGTTLELKSNTYGSESFVDIQILEEATGGTFRASIDQGVRDEGTDIVASVNGIVATGRGNTLSLNTSTLDLQATMAAEFTGAASFTITGGGALFQMGPNVVSNQQARIGINSVNTAKLGGVNGRLYQLAKGGTASLKANPNQAAKIVTDATNKLTSLRGRLGAFQRLTLETNNNVLQDTVVALQAAESSIRDTDFAKETANLTRAQILVQSSTAVLSIANQNPRNVLALLQ